MAALALVLAPAAPARADEAFDYTYEDGSLGFFEWLGADEAVSTIRQSPNTPVVGPYQDLDAMGSAGSAFNLDNMERSLDIIEKCNELRALPEHGVSELLVDPYLMAVGQINMNYSKGVAAHAAVYPVGENLAWGYPDPFVGWYTEEKEVWDTQGAAAADQVGHYLNIVNGSYAVTGAAYIPAGSCSEQAFNFVASADGAYTLADFRAKLAEYRSLLAANTVYEITATATSHGGMWVSVSKAKEGNVVTVRATPERGYVVDVSPLVLAEDGTVVSVTPTASANEYTFVMPASNVTVAVGYRLRFFDVDPANPGHWFFDAVMWAADNGVMNGYSDGTGRFGPNDTMTRAQLAGVLYNMAGNPAADLSALEAYVDAPTPGTSTAWAMDAVAWATEAGLMTGYDDGSARFGTADSTTREQFVTVLWRMAGEPAGTGDLSAFADGLTTSPQLQDAMSWAVGEGILNGYPQDNTLRPQGALTRAEAAAILMNRAEAAAN